MSDEQTLAPDSTEAAQTEEVGTTTPEQTLDTQPAAQSSGEMMQADYTRKTQELADQRTAFQTEQQNFYQQRQAQPQGYTQGQQAPQQTNDQQLVDQFGYDGAQLLNTQSQQLESKFNNMQFQMLYGQEVNAGKQKYGEEWDKHNYVDTATGELKNKVMDMRLMTNPLTNQSLTLEQAWAVTNPTNTQALQQKATDTAYAEMQGKQAATPAKSSGVTPQASGEGHATSVEEAFEQALGEQELPMKGD